ncbi:MarR family transcriptional regulator [Paenibacillus pasadenensis]|uniref:MarR family winged helix-turn-helix transcriptional regulator n=1 Tax=Paenibacillus pasadenensis TaxID=217090 RepID=UPI00203E5C1F|nr:MarR family transcriptional regulator [Paenibacillus pasadenensis]MCM3748402.1 MarR family transcriptional regulator [Paenibacillus pasadenensis]
MEEAKLKEIIERYEIASFFVTRRFNALVQDKLTGDMTREQFSIVRYLNLHTQSTSSELAEAFCVNKSSITSIINKLVDKGMIFRKPDQQDRRVIHLSLTEEGSRLAEQYGAIMSETLGGYIGHFSEDDAVQFIETFELLANRLKD